MFSMHFDDFLITCCRPTEHMRTELSLQSQYDLAGYGVSGIELFSNILRLLFQTTTQVTPDSIYRRTSVILGSQSGPIGAQAVSKIDPFSYFGPLLGHTDAIWRVRIAKLLQNGTPGPLNCRFAQVSDFDNRKFLIKKGQHSPPPSVLVIFVKSCGQSA